jgi:hypothetical protein
MRAPRSGRNTGNITRIRAGRPIGDFMFLGLTGTCFLLDTDGDQRGAKSVRYRSPNRNTTPAE